MVFLRMNSLMIMEMSYSATGLQSETELVFISI